MDIDDLIEYEHENTNLDFKSIQYLKEKYQALIKDVMAMANSDTKDDKYIIIGVNDNNGIDKEFLGIEESKFIDSATYQQIILENIEPSIQLDYFAHNYKGKLFGILQISNCFDRPYMMKKDYFNLKKGDTFIRKGSQQSRMTRRDYDKIDNSINLAEFTELYFANFPEQEEIELIPYKSFKLPSENAKTDITRILKQKKEKAVENTPNSLTLLSGLSYNIGGSYEGRTIWQLEKNLKNIKKDYALHDKYETFEVNAHKLNIVITNMGDSYLEDCTIKVIVTKVLGLSIASKLYTKPTQDPTSNRINSVPSLIPGTYPDSYPDVYQSEDTWIIKEEIGNIKHKIPTKAFRSDVRVHLHNNLIGETVNLECNLFAKNLTSPLQKNLKIKIIDR